MKLSGWTIIVIGLCLGLSALSYALFQVYLPSEEAAGFNRTYFGQLEAEAAKQKAAEKRVQKAMARVQEAAAAWNSYVLTRTPSSSFATGGANVNENEYQLVVDTPRFRNNAQREFNVQLRKGGVKIVAAPEIPQPTDSEKDILASFYNYPAYKFPVVLWELGSVTVSGRYAQIMANVRSWANMPHYLAVVDGLRIDGTSPNLTATYNVTLVGFIRANQVYPPPAFGGGATPASTPNIPGGNRPGGG